MIAFFIIKNAKKSRNFKFVLTKTKKMSIFKMFGPLAQLVEHKTFNLGVPGSSPGWATKDTICSGILENEINMLISFFLLSQFFKKIWVKFWVKILFNIQATIFHTNFLFFQRLKFYTYLIFKFDRKRKSFDKNYESK